MDETTITPLFDTWEVVKYAGSWVLEPGEPGLAAPENPEGEDRNLWLAAALERTVLAFQGFARPWRVYFDPIDRQSTSSIEMIWTPDVVNADFVMQVIDMIHRYPQPVASIDVDLEENVFVRTPESPHLPVRAWVRLPSDISINLGSVPYLAYNRSDSLFWSSSRWLVDNGELYRLNQPLLEQTLRRWEQMLGTITDVDGPEGIYRYGYRSEE